VRHECSTRRATSFTFTYGFSVSGALLVVSETRPSSEMSVTFVAVVTKVREGARRARHTVATRLFADVCGVTFTCFVARFTYVLFGHGTS